MIKYETREYADFGGTFDPITKRHLEAIQLVIDSGIADKVIVSPTYSPSYRSKVSNFSWRLAMAREAVESDLPKTYRGRVVVSPIERDIECINAITRLRALEQLLGSPPVMVVGSDYLTKATDLFHWPRMDEIVNRYGIVGIQREGYPVDLGTIPNGTVVLETGLPNGGGAKARQKAVEQDWDGLAELVPTSVFFLLKMWAEDGRFRYK